jgi:hypothetical protein
MRRSTHLCAAQGFTEGAHLWIPDWFKRFEGREFMIDTVVSAPANSLASATAWANAVWPHSVFSVPRLQLFLFVVFIGGELSA